MSKWNDGMFELTDESHYFVIMCELKPYDVQPEEYSGYHHSTKQSAQIELCYARGDDWSDRISDLFIKEVGA